MITSLQNAKIKNLVKLRRRRGRDRQKLMLIDGARALRAALNNGFAVDALYFYQTQDKEYADLLQQADRQGVHLQPVSAAVFNKISYGDAPDKILGVAPQPKFSLSRLPCPPNPLYIVADGLEKPGNLGAILRSADAAGVSGLIICNAQTDIYNPNVIRASRGAFFSVSLAQVMVDEVARWLRERNVQILAASPEAELRYTQADMRSATALVLGAEHAGLSEIWRSYPLVAIPMRGQADSLNVAQSASVLMFEALRQRESRLTAPPRSPSPAPEQQPAPPNCEDNS